MAFEGFTGLSNLIAENNLLIGFFLLISFIIWKFILQPRMNENEPIPGTQGMEQQE